MAATDAGSSSPAQAREELDGVPLRSAEDVLGTRNPCMTMEELKFVNTYLALPVNDGPNKPRQVRA